MAGEKPAALERRIREAALDETLAETFPASDPLSTLPNPFDETALDPPTPEGELVDRDSEGPPYRPL
jgi:hypothetical protein